MLDHLKTNGQAFWMISFSSGWWCSSTIIIQVILLIMYVHLPTYCRWASSAWGKWDHSKCLTICFQMVKHKWSSKWSSIFRNCQAWWQTMTAMKKTNNNWIFTLDTKIVSITRAFVNKLKKKLISSRFVTFRHTFQMVKHTVKPAYGQANGQALLAWPFDEICLTICKMLDHCNGQAFSRYGWELYRQKRWLCAQKKCYHRMSHVIMNCHPHFSMLCLLLKELQVCHCWNWIPGD